MFCQLFIYCNKRLLSLFSGENDVLNIICRLMAPTNRVQRGCLVTSGRCPVLLMRSRILRKGLPAQWQTSNFSSNCRGKYLFTFLVNSLYITGRVVHFPLLGRGPLKNKSLTVQPTLWHCSAGQVWWQSVAGRPRTIGTKVAPDSSLYL